MKVRGVIVDTILAKAEHTEPYDNFLKEVKDFQEKLKIASDIMTEAEARIDDEFK